MLFDLRGRGRRRAVQIIYLGLALLIGGGLIFFGIGGATSGGLLNAVDQNKAASNDVFEKNLKKAQAAVKQDPKDAAAWAAVAKAQYQLAGVGTNYDQQTGSFTASGKAKLAEVDTAWQKYLALDPRKPDDNVASLMVQAYGPTGLNNPDEAVRAFEIVVDQRKPSPNLYGQLAVLAWTAGQTRKGDLAEAKALSLTTSKAERAQLKAQLSQAKQQVAQDQAAAAQQAAGGAGAAGSAAPAGTP